MEKKKPPKTGGFLHIGGDEEDRTLDLTDANRTLSQLSYAPKKLLYYYSILFSKIPVFFSIFLKISLFRSSDDKSGRILFFLV